MTELIEGFRIVITLCAMIVLTVYAWLVATGSRGRKNYGIVLFAAVLLVAGFAEFFNELVLEPIESAASGEIVIEAEGSESYELFLDSTVLLAGLGLLWFVINVNRNIEKYR